MIESSQLFAYGQGKQPLKVWPRSLLQAYWKSARKQRLTAVAYGQTQPGSCLKCDHDGGMWGSIRNRNCQQFDKEQLQKLGIGRITDMSVAGFCRLIFGEINKNIFAGRQISYPS